MFSVGAATKIFLATGVTDLRRGFNGLHALVEHRLEASALSGNIFVFCNRRRDAIKLFFFDGTGMWVCAKRLEKGTYRWPEPGELSVQMSAAELQMLLSGIDLKATRKRAWWRPILSK
jgi:transposase